MTECTTYVLENGTNTGCNQRYTKVYTTDRFSQSFTTKLVHGNNTFKKEHNLKMKGMIICWRATSHWVTLFKTVNRLMKEKY